jgi:chromosome segregation ATPase
MEDALAMKNADLAQKDQTIDATQKQNQDLLNELAGAKNDLARRTNEAVAAEAGRKKLEEILGVQTGELTALQQQHGAMLTQITDLQTRNTRLNSRVLELTSNVTILTDQLRNLQEKLYASEQQVADLQQRMATGRRVASATEAPAGAVPVASAVAGPIRGEITEIDGNYASINIGETSGVVAGMTFMVHRDSTFVAELVIDKVQPKLAGGKLRTVQQAVRRGDAVAYGLEGTE